MMTVKCTYSGVNQKKHNEEKGIFGFSELEFQFFQNFLQGYDFLLKNCNLFFKEQGKLQCSNRSSHKYFQGNKIQIIRIIKISRNIRKNNFVKFQTWRLFDLQERI